MNILFTSISVISTRSRKIILLGICIFTAITISSQNLDSKTERHIDLLLKQMTLSEKIGQMNQLHIENTQRVKNEINKSNALLYAWFSGTMGGPAIADLLFGNEVPSGKLFITFLKSV
ncbi:MAG: glycoside hydrolase family 3 C-terminal domain-containing protein [Paludibacter sp.]|nr:glycoside hydrolase family 3 C-terminal domain-containing protein [Paludibacter sp.]